MHVLLEAVRALRAGAYELKIFGNPNVFPITPPSSARWRPACRSGSWARSIASATADVYAQIDVLVVPSLWLENSPLVIHEAFMAGIPVVGARIGGIADLVDDGRTGLLYEPRRRASWPPCCADSSRIPIA